jgi:hypothetical protein
MTVLVAASPPVVAFGAEVAPWVGWSLGWSLGCWLACWLGVDVAPADFGAEITAGGVALASGPEVEVW